MKKIAQKKKMRNVVTSYCHNLHVIFKKISVNVFQEVFLVRSKGAAYIFYSREDRFCWIAVILPAYFFSLMQDMLDFLCQSYLKLP